MDNSTSTFTLDSCDLVSQASKALAGAQTEIMIFLFAFGIHALFFGRLKVRTKQAAPSDAKKVQGMGNGHMPKAHPPPRCIHAKELAHLAEKFCEMKDATEVAADLSLKIETVPTKDLLDALGGLLEGAGRNATAQLLAAVRQLLRERGLKPNTDVGELLLRNYFGLRLLSEFDEVYTELIAEHGAMPNLGVLALKASLRSANFEACLERMECLQPLWSKETAATPSAGPVALLLQLVRLAAQEDALPRFLKRLQDIHLIKDALGTVLVDCVQRGDSAHVEAVLKFSQTHGLQFDEAAYCALIKNTTGPGEAMNLFVEAVGILKKAARDVLSVAAAWALDNNDEPLANAVLGKLPQSPPGEAVGKLLLFFSKTNGADAALKMYVAKFNGTDLSSDAAAMHLIASAIIEQGGKSGQSLLETLLASTTTETARVTLLKAFGSEKHLQGALAVLRSSPDKSACLYNSAIDACIDCRSIDDAQQVMSEAVKAGVADTISYNTIVKAYLQAKRPQEARRAVESMKAAGLHPNCVTFNELLDAVVKNSIEDAWPVLEEMQASHSRPNRITCAILLKAVQARTKQTDVERVIAVIEEIDEDLDEVLLCSVVDACIRAGRPELLIPQLQRHRATGKSPVKSPHTYGSIIRAYGFVHNIACVWETWREMRTRHVQANAVTLGCMTEALVTNNEPEAAYELINEMIKDPEWAPLINAVIYCSVLKGFSHQKRFDRLWTVYKEMLGHKLQFSIVTFNTLVDACSRNNEMARIPALLEDMVGQGIPPNIITYSAILKGYCQENRIEEAFSVVEGMVQTTNFRPDEIMFNTLLDGCARQGLYERGISVLTDMQKANIVPTNFTLSVLVKLASRSKKLDKAFELCQEIAGKYKFRLNVHVYSNLINACITNKDLNRAFDVMEKMLSERVRPDTRGYSLLLRACVSMGRPEEAAGLLRAAVGLGGVHARLAKYDARLLQAQGGLPTPLITEILESMASHCRDEHLAVTLLKEIRSLPHVKLDPKLQFRLAQSALKR